MINKLWAGGILLATLLLAGGCSDERSAPLPLAPAVEPEPPIPEFEFSALDASFQQFIDENAVFDGISYVLVEKDLGLIHEAALGDHTLDTVALLASTSKVPTVTLLMALNDDDSLDYDVEATIDNYLPWEGVYGDRTTVQLVSNTSGIPGLASLAMYGAHLCQYIPAGTLEACAQVLYQNELPGTVPPATKFDYGGTQWQLSGAVAEQVTNSTWRQIWDSYIGTPCELEIFQYGNPLSAPTSFDGNPDNLPGLDNPNMEGGALTNLRDYANILMLHLNDGRCGDEQILASGSVDFMRIDRGGEFGVPYGMGWWIITNEDGSEPSVFYDPGAWGAVSWIDIERGIGGYVAINDYTSAASGDSYEFVLGTVIPEFAAAVDEARAAVGQ